MMFMVSTKSGKGVPGLEQQPGEVLQQCDLSESEQ